MDQALPFTGPLPLVENNLSFLLSTTLTTDAPNNLEPDSRTVHTQTTRPWAPCGAVGGGEVVHRPFGAHSMGSERRLTYSALALTQMPPQAASSLFSPHVYRNLPRAAFAQNTSALKRTCSVLHHRVYHLLTGKRDT